MRTGPSLGNSILVLMQSLVSTGVAKSAFSLSPPFTFSFLTGRVSCGGKNQSNILDAICFVLGITNLAQVRVSSLQELVYKQGQAGVTKASVTIVFNNEAGEDGSKTASPVGYEQYDKITVTRQVVIGGRSKYLINGINAPTNRVQNLFHSVQLNINNPHFLIMQGRITKVLNMKPVEILAMIEEAAGTRMYEAKKQQTLRTIEKKQAKVAEIDKILEEDIKPKLERLRFERQQYVQFTTQKTDIERLARLVVAHEFWAAERTAKSSGGETQAIQREVAELAETAERLARELEETKRRIEEMTKAREKEVESEMKRLEEAASSRAEELVKCTAAARHAEELTAQESEQLSSLRASLEETRAAIKKKEKELAASRAAREAQEKAHSRASALLKELQRQFETASIGVSVEEGRSDAASATDSLVRARKEASEADADAKQLDMQIKHRAKELKEKKAALEEAGGAARKLQREIDDAAAEVTQLREAMGRQGADPSKLQAVVEQRKLAAEQASTLRERVDELSARLTQLQYLPREGLPSSIEAAKVKGLVAELIEVPDAKNSLAIEVTAGGRLYNVVVEDEATGKQLLSSGKLRRRVTIIPLNKIQARSIGQRTLAAAEAAAGSKAHVALALSLVGFDEEIRSATQYVFGSTIVCKDAETARAVAFHPDVRTRCVTLAGDVYDPSGTLTGGAPPSARPVLADLHELNEARAGLADADRRVADLGREAETLRAAATRCEDVSRRHELAAHRCELLRARFEASEASQLARQAKELEETLAARKGDLVRAKERKAAALARAEELQAKEKALKSGGREEEIKRLEEEIAAAKAELATAVKELAEATQLADRSALEHEALEKERDAVAGQATAAEAAVERARKQEAASREALAKATTQSDRAKEELDRKRTSIQTQSEAIRQLLKARDDVYRKQSETEVAQKKAEAKAQRQAKDRAEAERFVAAMLSKHAWIAADRQHFGKRGTEYDWSSDEGAVDRARARLATLQAEHEHLTKTINRKAVAMFDTAERDCQELIRKKEIVQNDRQKIAAVIAELDTKKGEALRATWKKVDSDFTSIFSSLLPGATAKLEPPSGGTGDVVKDGLEVHVALGGVWKEGLTELSGGQRSLLALSLILALLRFKPAPVYILDEVDAALDPSHTQNIGKMLALHFRASQFIVVSLKKGMWGNANVLFKCRCVDGVSTVTRVATKDAPDREADLIRLQDSAATSAAAGAPPASKQAGEEADDDEAPLKRRKK